jgi:hypothetical protein
MQSLQTKIKRCFFLHFEWVVFSLGLILMATMDPLNTGFSFCLFDMIGVTFCPGEGLGKSIAWLFRGDFSASYQAHPAGSITVIILTLRIFHLIKIRFNKPNMETTHGQSL